MRSRRSRWPAALAAALAWTMVSPLLGARTERWTVTAASMARGRADGVAVSDRGVLSASPSPRLVDERRLAGEPAQVWSIATDRSGNIYLGTGPEGKILRISPTGQQSVLFATAEPLVTALIVDTNGDLLAGTAPGGTVYRIDPGGVGAPWCETGERYVWALARTAGGQLLAGTGERGAVVRIDAAGEAAPFFDSEESHVMRLLALPDGGLLAGGAGRGMVYQIDEEGNALVLYDGDLDEVSALAVDDRGDAIVALLSAPEFAGRRPEVRLRLPDGTPVGRTPDDGVEGLAEPQGPVVQGIIEGLERPKSKPTRVRGRIVRVRPDGSTETLWNSSRESPFSLLAEPNGRLLFGTGEPGRLYGVGGDGEIALLATLAEGQVTRLARSGGGSILTTSNSAALYEIPDEGAETGVFLSEPIDAGGPARWGSIRWTVSGAGGEFYTRTGNSRIPDGTWSAWSPTLSEADGSPIVNPDGRFLQWRLRLPPLSPARVSGVIVFFEPYNRPPEPREVRFDPPVRAVAAEAIVRWSAHDPDGDAVEAVLQTRAGGTSDWREAARGSSDSDTAEAGAAAGRNDAASGKLTWTTLDFPEGPYELRLVLTDGAANPPGEGGRAVLDTLPPVIVDRTPPAIDVRSTDGGYEFTVRDAHSEVARLELSREGRRQHTLRPVDGVCDSAEETFRMDEPVGSGWIARGIDAAGNAVETPLN